MSRKALTDQHHELIMEHILNPDASPLPIEHQEMLDRVISMSKLLDRYPTIKQAVAVHLSKYDISPVTAYRDVRLARKVYNSIHEFDYDFYRSWVINDIIANIERCRNKESYQNNRVIAAEHANLIKIIGEKPQEITDPLRNEKHQFYIMVNVNNQNIKIDLNNLHNLPEGTLRELNKALVAGEEIDDQGAVEIMES